ncbi:MAG: c-type cytochrome biogenesis protein CcmI [Proteobacteria bacterium]|nr:c-type cytochrome biogenesis protein CcmI [Pseudomonadota bacterium]
MLWFALTALAVCAGLLVALPFLRTRRAPPAAATSVDVYKAQLDAIARDEAAGDVDASAAVELRTEVERRILEAPPAAPVASPASAQFDRVTAAAVALIVVLGSAVLYAATGAPQMQSAARGADAAPAAAAAQSLPDVDTMIQRLRARLESSPNDAEGWRMLGWSYFETNHFPEAVDAYRRAVALAPQEASYKSALAEAVTQANGGSVTAAARQDFQTALSRDAHDERARYYLALAKSQSGDARGAIDDWIAGVRAAAPDSQWAPRMRESAETAARQIGLNIAGRMPPAPAASLSRAPPLSAGVVAQAQQASPEAQQQMIAGMVDGLEQRLAQNPRDADGWVRLMRSRMVLGQADRAGAALQSALRAFNGDGAAQQRLRAAATELNVPGA